MFVFNSKIQPTINKYYIRDSMQSALRELHLIYYFDFDADDADIIVSRKNKKNNKTYKLV
jgi:hypothetical protein